MTSRPTLVLLATLGLASGAALSQQPSPTPAPNSAAPAPAASAPAAPAAAPAAKKPASGPVQIKVGDDIVFRFGTLLQAQADWQERPAGGYAQNLFLRRARLIVAGQVAKNVSFFFQTDSPRLGQVNAAGTKVISTGLIVQDAVFEWRVAKAFNLWAGLIYVPTSREALKSSSSEFMLDLSAYAYVATTALTGVGGRDTGFMARGYFLDDRLEYRAGAFQGLRDAASRNPFRFVGRVQYNFFDREVYNLPAYVASNFGTKKILAVGVGYDTQKDYEGVTADVFADIPVPFGSVVGIATYQRLDGGTFLPTALQEQDTFSADAGLYFKGSKVGPWARYEQRSYAEPNGSRDEKRFVAGLNYYVSGNNLNLKAGWGRVSPKTGNDTDQFTIQLQAGFY